MLLPDFDPNAGGTTGSGAGANNSQDNTGENNQQANQENNPGQQNSDPKKSEKDSSAEIRYQISRERELRKQAEARYKELETKSNTAKPEFNQETDPDGTKELEYKAKEIAQREIEEFKKQSGISEEIEKLKYAREMDEFYGKIEAVNTENFGKYGLSISKEKAISVMKDLDEKGITPLQVAILANAESVISKMRPEAIKPGDGGKVNSDQRQLTQEEINAQIFARHGAFGYGK